MFIHLAQVKEKSSLIRRYTQMYADKFQSPKTFLYLSSSSADICDICGKMFFQLE